MCPRLDSVGLGFPHISSLYPNNVIEVWYQMSIKKKILWQLFKSHWTFKWLFYTEDIVTWAYLARKGRRRHQILFLLHTLIISWSILCVLITFSLPSSTLSRHPQLCALWESILRPSRPIYSAQIFFVHVFSIGAWLSYHGLYTHRENLLSIPL